MLLPGELNDYRNSRTFYVDLLLTDLDRAKAKNACKPSIGAQIDDFSERSETNVSHR